MADINTTMANGATVYAGPGTTYFRIGSVSAGESVAIKFRESSYCYIEYYIGNTSNKKCGYVRSTDVNNYANMPLTTTTLTDRWVHITTQTKWGPGANYPDARPLPRGTKVLYTNIKINNYALVHVTLSGEMYRLFILSNYLGTGSITIDARTKMASIANLEVGYTEVADNDTKYGDWIGAPNAAWCASFVSWCAAFADNATTTTPASSPLVYKTAGVSNLRTGFGSARLKSTPVVGAVAFFTGSHVGMVTSVSSDGNTIDVVEGNSGSTVIKTSFDKDSYTGHYVGDNGTITIFGY